MHTTTKTLIVRAAALGLAALALAPAHAVETYTNFDNFTGATQIDPTKWNGRERHRLIEGGALRMIQRDLGSQPDNSGAFADTWGTSLPNQTLVKQIKATITVNAFDITGCAANPSNISFTQARIAGEFFNAGPGVPSSTNRTNDVGAVIRLRRDSNSADAPGLLRVQGTVYQCTTADCNYGTVSLGDVDLGTATIGEAVTLRLDWDQPNKRFNFYRGTDPVQRVNYTVSDAQAPGNNYRQVGTRNFLANCLAGRTSGFMDAKFDNVYVNTSAAP